MTKDEALDLALEALEYALPVLDSAWYNQSQAFKAQVAITAIKQARSAPMTKDELTEPLGCVVVRPLVANSTTPPAAQQDIQRLRALVRAQQITIDKLEQARSAPVQEPVALPCCGYTDASAVKWNPFNGVMQCHNCGQTYTPPAGETK